MLVLKIGFIVTLFVGRKLFGEALNDVLVENRDKKKVLPSKRKEKAFRRGKFQSFFCEFRQPFRPRDQVRLSKMGKNLRIMEGNRDNMVKGSFPRQNK